MITNGESFSKDSQFEALSPIYDVTSGEIQEFIKAKLQDVTLWDMTPTFSIIIPHKDIPGLLMRCLRSIPVSENIQVIVVDDNSVGADTYLDRYPELSRPLFKVIR